MGLIPTSATFKKGKLLYRKIRYSQGHGVHSPFVFGLISKVVNVKCAYYSQEAIEKTRKKALSMDNKQVAETIRKEGISPKTGALLTRLANHFKPERILQIGSSAGISALYLTAHSKTAQCTILEKRPDKANIAKHIIDMHGSNSINIITGEYDNTLPKVLTKDQPFDQPFDFIIINPESKPNNTPSDTHKTFINCLPFIKDSTIIAINNINKDKHTRQLWQTACKKEQATVTIDMYSIGLIFFNRKLHKRNYIVYH